MMKHEHNFLLYGIASASLLVSGAMLLSNVSFQDNSQVASVVEVSAVVLEKDQKISSISGKVSTHEEVIDVHQRKVQLLRENSRGEVSLFDTVTTDEEGNYIFEDVPPGQYGIRLVQKEGEAVTLPPEAIANFSYASNTRLVFLDTDGGNYEEMDFYLETQEKE